MRTSTIVVAAMAFAVGLAVWPAWNLFGGQRPGGANVKCIAGGRACVGMKPELAVYLDDEIGGALDVSCGFTEPGAGATRQLHILELMRVDCAETKYVVSYSNGRRLTNVWVDNGKIVRLDDYPRHSFDP